MSTKAKKRTSEKIKAKRVSTLLHLLTIALTCAFFGFLAVDNFSFIIRLLESCVDLKNSFLYYVKNVFEIGPGAEITVNNFSIAEQELFFHFPSSWEEFKQNFIIYWQKWGSWENLKGYFSYIINHAKGIALFLAAFSLPIIVFYLLVKKRLEEIENNDYNRDTIPLRCFKKLVCFPLLKVKLCIVRYLTFLREHPKYVKTWIFLSLLVFNGIGVIIEAIAYYFYFICSFDAFNLYRQVYKLILDASYIIDFIPVFLWVVLAYVLLCRFRAKIGYRTLNHQEMKNRGFQNERAVCSEYCGTMGTGKTTAITTQGMSQEVMFRDKALEKIIENDLKFPNFPWINLENDLKKAIESEEIFNLKTTRDFIQRRYLTWHQKKKKDKYLWEYDTEHFRIFYDNGLSEVSVWRVIENYAQLYFIYITQSSLILANYSVRNACQLLDTGNLPLWFNDFFAKHSVSEEKQYRYCHILDFDMLRLGCKVLKNNVLKDVLEFGVILITEVGKERGNTLENREVKKNSDEANQKNDKLENMLKMIRHAATVDNYCFVRIIMDEQRAASLGANARELCDIVTIFEAEKGNLALPFFEVEYLLRNLIFKKFFDLYTDYRQRRGDNSLLMFLFKNIFGFFNDRYVRIINTFGYDVLTVGVEKSMQQGEIVKQNKIYISYKKTRAMRFSTDCISGFFKQKASQSTVGFEEIPEYRFVMASFSELAIQNSYFINEMLTANEVDPDNQTTVIFFPYVMGNMPKRKKTQKKKVH